MKRPNQPWKRVQKRQRYRKVRTVPWAASWAIDTAGYIVGAERIHVVSAIVARSGGNIVCTVWFATVRDYCESGSCRQTAYDAIEFS